MNPLKLSVILIIAFTAFSCAGKHNLNVEIKGLGNDTIFVEYLPVTQFYQLEEPFRDTVFSSNDRFFYDVPCRDTVIAFLFPAKSRFTRLDGTTYRPVFIDILLKPDDRIRIKGSLYLYTIDYNSDGSEIYDEYSTNRRSYLEESSDAIEIELKLDTLIHKNGDPTAINNLFTRRNEIFELIRAKKLEYIKRNYDRDLAGLYLLDQKADTIGKYYDSLTPDVKQGPFKFMLENRYTRYQKFVKVKEAELNIREGSIAPDFSLTDKNGADFNLNSIQNKFIVLDFWGSWCGPCMIGIPKMKKYYDQYRSQIEFIGIACNDSEEKWKQSIRENQLDWVNLINNSTLNLDVSVRYGIKSYPTKILLDKDKKIIAKFIGEGDDFYKKLDELLK